MANTFLTADMITKEALRVLVNNMVFAKKMGRELNKEWNQDRKIGETVRVRKPAKYSVRTGKTFAAQDIVEEYTSVSIDTMKGVDVSFDSSDLALNIQSFSDIFLKPAVSRLAHEIDYDCMSLAMDIAGAAGTPGSGTLDADTVLTAKAILDEGSCPTDPERTLIVDPRTEIKAVSALKGLLNPGKELSEQYRMGSMGQALGFDWFMSQNVNRLTVGAQGGTPLVDGAGQTGATLVTKGWTAAAAARLNKGDVFTIAGVYKLNPANQRSTGQLQQFLVTADFASGADGKGGIAIYPSIVTAGASATVTAAPADGAAITVIGTANATSAANLAFHRDAFKLVFVELPQPKGMDMASTISVPEVGLSISFVRGFDISDRSFKSRLDVLYGKKTVRPEFACRLHM
jgi:FlaG/FlaF family flagellin (archaellin)